METLNTDALRPPSTTVGIASVVMAAVGAAAVWIAIIFAWPTVWTLVAAFVLLVVYFFQFDNPLEVVGVGLYVVALAVIVFMPVVTFVGATGADRVSDGGFLASLFFFPATVTIGIVIAGVGYLINRSARD